MTVEAHLFYLMYFSGSVRKFKIHHNTMHHPNIFNIVYLIESESVPKDIGDGKHKVLGTFLKAVY